LRKDKIKKQNKTTKNKNQRKNLFFFVFLFYSWPSYSSVAYLSISEKN